MLMILYSHLLISTRSFQGLGAQGDLLYLGRMKLLPRRHTADPSAAVPVQDSFQVMSTSAPRAMLQARARFSPFSDSSTVPKEPGIMAASPGGIRQDTPAAPHPRVHHGQVDRPLRKRGRRRPEQERGRLDVPRGDLMGDVHQRRPGRQTEDRALDGGDVVVGGAEVGQESEKHFGFWILDFGLKRRLKGRLKRRGARLGSPRSSAQSKIQNRKSKIVPPPRIQSRPVSARRLLLFTKPAREGRVKTRLIGDLTPAQAAARHTAFLDDLLDRLRKGEREGGFELRLAWALDAEEAVPAGPLPGIRQEGRDLGERLYRALSGAAAEAKAVMALASDHPTLPLELVHRAFERIERGADVVLGPAEDGGYYLIALRPEAVAPRLFAGIAWSTPQVLAATLDRCRELGLRVELLPEASDVDTPEDLRRLAARMAAEGDLGCPRTRSLLTSLGLLQSQIQNPKSKIEGVVA